MMRGVAAARFARFETTWRALTGVVLACACVAGDALAVPPGPAVASVAWRDVLADPESHANVAMRCTLERDPGGLRLVHPHTVPARWRRRIARRWFAVRCDDDGYEPVRVALHVPTVHIGVYDALRAGDQVDIVLWGAYAPPVGPMRDPLTPRRADPSLAGLLLEHRPAEQRDPPDKRETSVQRAMIDERRAVGRIVICEVVDAKLEIANDDDAWARRARVPSKRGRFLSFRCDGALVRAWLDPSQDASVACLQDYRDSVRIRILGFYDGEPSDEDVDPGGGLAARLIAVVRRSENDGRCDDGHFVRATAAQTQPWTCDLERWTLPAAWDPVLTPYARWLVTGVDPYWLQVRCRSHDADVVVLFPPGRVHSAERFGQHVELQLVTVGMLPPRSIVAALRSADVVGREQRGDPEISALVASASPSGRTFSCGGPTWDTSFDVSEKGGTERLQDLAAKRQRLPVRCSNLDDKIDVVLLVDVRQCLRLQCAQMQLVVERREGRKLYVRAVNCAGNEI